MLTPFCWPESNILAAQWLADEEPRAVGDPMHVETSFRWNLGDLICVRQHTGPAHEGNSRTMGMHAGEESDGCIVPVKHRTMPSDIGGDGGGKAAGRGEGELQRMLRTQRRTKHVTDAANPRIGAARVPNTPKADHV